MDDEVKALIHVWSDKRIRKQLEGAIRNKGIFQQIAWRLQKFGIDRDWKQCRTKYKNLKYEYKTTKKAQDLGNIWRTMKFFNELDNILGNKASRQPNNTENEDDGSSETFYKNKTEEPSVEFDEEDSISNTSEDPVASQIKEKMPDLDDDSTSTTSEDQTVAHTRKETARTDDQMPLDEAVSQLRVITVNDTGVGRHWSDDEVRALIYIWSDESIRQQLEGATRNKEIFEQIAKKLMKFGIDRDWKQCRTKYKNLKCEYRALQRRNNQLVNPKRTMKFYDEVDGILRRTMLQSNERVHSTVTRCSVLEQETPSKQTSGLDYSAESEEEDTSSTVEGSVTWGVKRKVAEEDLPSAAKKSCSDFCTRSATTTEAAVGEDAKKPEESPPSHHTVQRPADHPRVTLIPSPKIQIYGSVIKMEKTAEVKIGRKLNEGKTKEVYELPELPGYVLMQSKDQITAGNAARKDQMEGKAAVSNKTTSCVFKLLQEAGMKTAFVRKHSDTAFVAAHCEMIPIEWVCRRIVTGSFLKRNPGVKEGYKFNPPKIELFFKDDANNDPQWSEEQLLEANFSFGGLGIGRCEVDIMNRSTLAVFEILERAWATLDCTLVDMKIEFGVHMTTKEIVLADVIDNDSWRLWPAGDRSQQKDKQVYRDLKEVTPEALQMVKRNFEWVAEKVQLLLEPKSSGRVVVLMGSTSDLGHCEKIKKACANYGIPCDLRVTSAHKGPDETLRIKAEYEGDGVPTVFVAVAGRSNGLGPVMAGNTIYPVINCPPLTADWGAQDIWSSLRMPSGLGCTTVLSPEAAAQFAAQIFGLNNHVVWAKLRTNMLNTWIMLKQADKKMRYCTL
nr:PREDICTED: multifunctional protein ADE2 [Latimeria chalumnae]|eukprot:XP_014346374.1 PREDICTED: multifunctional protein ADE2 [Latimeria chalumnae]